MSEAEKILKDYRMSKMALEIMQAEVDEKKEAVIKVLREAPDGKMEAAGAYFSLRSYVTYEYTGEVKSLEEKVKEAKQAEVAEGKATVKSETFAPVMRVAKGRKGGEQ